jgi:type II secretion system protein N
VRKFTRLVVALVLAAIGATVVVLIAANLYVQSQQTQVRIQQELSHRLGATLRVQRISVTPWGGLQLSGISIPQIPGTVAGDFLHAKSFRLRVRFFSLFSRRLVINEVSLIGPTVVWPQNAEGKWRLPFLKEGTPATAMAENLPEPSPPAQIAANESSAAPLPATAPTIPEAPREKTTGDFAPEVRKVNVTGGNFRFLDRAGEMVATFERVNFRSSVRNALSLHGNARVTKISLRDRFFLEQLQSPLRYDPGALDLSNISAHAGGGDVNGRFTLQTEAKDSPFSLSVRFRNVQADQLIVEAGGPSGILQGKLEGNLEAAGKTADANALSGAGEILLRDGQLRQYSLLVALGQILQIEELTQLHLEHAQAKYHISPGLVTIDELVLRSPNIRLTATGTVGFNGKLRLDSQLAINEKVRGQLFKPIRTNFQPTKEPGYSGVDFEVSGTLEHPKTNLMERVVGRDLKDIVGGLFGRKKSDRPKKKKPAGAEVAPADAESPEPSTSPSVLPIETASPPPP